MSEDAHEPLGYQLHRLALALRTEVTTRALDPAGLTFPQYICLRIVSHAPGRTNAQLARDVGVSPQAMNMVVRSLEDRGLVRRPASGASGRSLPAELTPKGVRVLGQLMDGVRDAELTVLAPLTDAQRGEFRALLTLVT